MHHQCKCICYCCILLCVTKIKIMGCWKFIMLTSWNIKLMNHLFTGSNDHHFSPMYFAFMKTDEWVWRMKNTVACRRNSLHLRSARSEFFGQRINCNYLSMEPQGVWVCAAFSLSLINVVHLKKNTCPPHLAPLSSQALHKDCKFCHRGN